MISLLTPATDRGGRPEDDISGRATRQWMSTLPGSEASQRELKVSDSEAGNNTGAFLRYGIFERPLRGIRRGDKNLCRHRLRQGRAVIMFMASREPLESLIPAKLMWLTLHGEAGGRKVLLAQTTDPRLRERIGLGRHPSLSLQPF